MSRVKSFSIPALLLVLSALFLTGCVSLGHSQPVSRNLSDPAIKNQNQLVKFFMKQNPEADINLRRWHLKSRGSWNYPTA